MLLEFAIANDLGVSNTWFKKRDSHLISSGHSTQIDYVLYHKSFSSAISNVKVILNEKCAKQMDRRNQEIVGENCVRNDTGELVHTD